MFEQDYLMRMLLSFAQAIRRSMLKTQGQSDPKASAHLIEAAIGEATEMDGDILLSLAPESFAGVLKVSGTDPRVVEYVAQSLLLEASFLRDDGNHEKANLRKEQAYSLARAYQVEIGLEELTEEEWEEFFSQDKEPTQEEIEQLNAPPESGLR